MPNPPTANGQRSGYTPMHGARTLRFKGVLGVNGLDTHAIQLSAYHDEPCRDKRLRYHRQGGPNGIGICGYDIDDCGDESKIRSRLAIRSMRHCQTEDQCANR